MSKTILDSRAKLNLRKIIKKVSHLTTVKILHQNNLPQSRRSAKSRTATITSNQIYQSGNLLKLKLSMIMITLNTLTISKASVLILRPTSLQKKLAMMFLTMKFLKTLIEIKKKVYKKCNNPFNKVKRVIKI
jgi:hypothetical protein